MIQLPSAPRRTTPDDPTDLLHWRWKDGISYPFALLALGSETDLLFLIALKKTFDIFCFVLEAWSSPSGQQERERHFLFSSSSWTFLLLMTVTTLTTVPVVPLLETEQ